MRPHHRIPSIFNLSMVDVLCCALGCVILLWLLNFREARRKAVAAGESGKLLAQARVDLKTAASQKNVLENDLAVERVRYKDLAQVLAGLRQEMDETTRQARARQQELTEQLTKLRADLLMTAQQAQLAQKNLKETQGGLRQARAEGAKLSGRLKDLEAEYALLEEALTQKNRDYAALTKQKEKSLTEQAALKTELQKKESLVQKLVQLSEAQSATLQKAEERIDNLRQTTQSLQDTSAKLKKDLDMRTRQRGEADDRILDLLLSKGALEMSLKDRDKQLAEVRTTLGGLKRDNDKLAAQVKVARQELENRFAGIALTGRKVVFLVDMSGSMEMVDDKTPAPDKWPLVCEILGRILASLTDVTHFQVILFSDKVSYPLGEKGRWLKYDPKASVRTTVETLKKIKPKGETNMSAAFAEAFRFRSSGLDTVYILSDGLPNAGDGLPESAKKLKWREQTPYYSRYVRNALKTAWNRPAADGSRVRINAVGFFYESPEVGSFLWALARENDGSFVGMSRP
jgi:hypothetical protein